VKVNDDLRKRVKAIQEKIDMANRNRERAERDDGLAREIERLEEQNNAIKKEIVAMEERTKKMVEENSSLLREIMASRNMAERNYDLAREMRKENVAMEERKREMVEENASLVREIMEKERETEAIYDEIRCLGLLPEFLHEEDGVNEFFALTINFDNTIPSRELRKLSEICMSNS